MVYVNDVPFGEKSFPNGETIFNTSDQYTRDANNEISLVYESDSDIFKLIVAKRCLDEEMTRCKVKHSFFNAYATLKISYMPYSRMDRDMPDMAFSLKYIAEIINSLNFDNVQILTPHSNVTPALINNVEAIYDVGVAEAYQHSNSDYIFYPDNGACKSFG